MISADFIPKIYVVSLLRATKRRESISKQLSQYGIDFIFVDAVDAKQVGSGFLLSQVDESKLDRPLTGPEIACALSHRAAYHDIVKNGHSGGLVLEDDAVIQPLFLDAIAYFCLEGKNFEGSKVIYNLEFLSRPYSIYTFIRRRTKLRISENLYFVEGIKSFSYQPWGSAGYYITREAAASMLSSQKIEMVTDNWALWEFRTGGKILFACPPAIIHPEDRSDSEIEKSRYYRKKNMSSVRRLFDLYYIAFKWRLYKFVLKPIFERVL